jgi:hypothetical protein
MQYLWVKFFEVDAIVRVRLLVIFDMVVAIKLKSRLMG